MKGKNNWFEERERERKILGEEVKEGKGKERETGRKKGGKKRLREERGRKVRGRC